MNNFTKLFILSAFLFATNANAQYCMLPGRAPYDTDEPGIIFFRLNTINRSSANVESMSGVVVTTGDSTGLMRGRTYTILITHSRDSISFPTVHNNIRVWLDYNKNYSFTDTGETIISANLETPGLFSGTFTVPMTAPLGITRLRATVKMSEEGGHTLPTACDSPADPLGYHGEMEDYKVNIIASTGITESVANTNDINIYPNPTTNHITVAFDAIDNLPVSIEPFDITGKLVGDLLNKSMQSSPIYDFDLARYVSSPGIYFIKITSGSGTSFQKIVIGNQ